jgi:hypothetical protein
MHPDSDCDGLDMVGKIRRLSNQPNWFHSKIRPESTGIVETSQRSDSVLVLRHRLLGRVSRRSPLGTSPGVTHALILYLFSSCRHIRFGFCLDQFCHRTVSPSSICETPSRKQYNFACRDKPSWRGHSCVTGDNQRSRGVVIARNRSLGALDHQRRDLHSIKLSYLTEDRAASTITKSRNIPCNMICISLFI